VNPYEPQLSLLGAGENGHLASNDPLVAVFHDPADVKIVASDEVCSNQQVKQGPMVEQVPEPAITLTIPMLFRVPQVIVSLPGKRKAKIFRNSRWPMPTDCPAPILPTHPNITMYPESGAE
jgi:glucosamine-6-phosphate deaminase